MDIFVRTYGKRQLLILSCSIILIILLVREFAGRFLSNREFVVGLVAVGLGMSIVALTIGARTFKEFGVIPGAITAPDEATRKRRLLAIRCGKAMIVLMVIALVTGLIRGGPFLPVMVGVIMNICITASLMWWIDRLQKSLQ